MKNMFPSIFLLALLCCAAPATICGQTPAAAAPAAERAKPVGAGDVAPDFTLEDEQGRRVSLADARGKSGVVLVFYRGWW
jgi:cytochrome oxidase Cu insertion factor (SCO1/SenC/PrrC family)